MLLIGFSLINPVPLPVRQKFQYIQYKIINAVNRQIIIIQILKFCAVGLSGMAIDFGATLPPALPFGISA